MRPQSQAQPDSPMAASDAGLRETPVEMCLMKPAFLPLPTLLPQGTQAWEASPQSSRKATSTDMVSLFPAR